MLSLSSERAKDRATAIWNKLHDAYGESLTRKFGPTPPDLWISLLSALKDHEIERGIARLLASGRREVPALPEFRRLCVEVGDTPGALPDTIIEPPFLGDQWTVYANTFLLRLILTQGSKRRYFDAEETGRLVKLKNMFAADLRDMAVAGKIPMSTVNELWGIYTDDIVKRK